MTPSGVHNRSTSWTPWSAHSPFTHFMQMAPPLVDVEELEDSIKPIYLQESSVFRAYLREKQRQEDLKRMGVIIVSKATNEPKWKVEDVDLNAWRENTIDNRTIYMKPRDTDCSSAKVKPPSPQKDKLLPEDMEYTQERKYITRSRTGPASAEQSDSKRFWSQTMKQYNRPVDKADDIPYRSPRAYPTTTEQPEINTDFMKAKEPAVESITKVPNKLKSLPRKLRAIQCKERGQFSHEFCDVLGPSACRICIELANRKIAGEVQKAAFPALDCTVTTLVAPKLAKFMALGDKTMKLKPKKGVPGVRASILKLPNVDDGTGKRFGRAGIERAWEMNAKVFYAANRNAVIASS